MSKLAHSADEYMAQIERNAARENGDLRQCRICGAENILDDPDCPRGGVGCEFFTVPPTRSPDQGTEVAAHGTETSGPQESKP